MPLWTVPPPAEDAVNVQCLPTGGLLGHPLTCPSRPHRLETHRPENRDCFGEVLDGGEVGCLSFGTDGVSHIWNCHLYSELYIELSIKN